MQMIEGSLVAIQVFWNTWDSKIFPIEAIAHLIIAIICKTMMRLIAVIVLWKSTLVAVSCCNELNFPISKQFESEKKLYLITKQNKHFTDWTKKEVNTMNGKIKHDVSKELISFISSSDPLLLCNEDGYLFWWHLQYLFFRCFWR